MDDTQVTRKVIPTDMSGVQNDRRPPTPIVALMEAAPNQHPEESQEELEERMELWIEPLAGALDKLDERERYIVTQVVVLNRSYRSVAKELKLDYRSVYDILNGRDDGKFPTEGALNKLRKHIEKATEVEL